MSQLYEEIPFLMLLEGLEAGFAVEFFALGSLFVVARVVGAFAGFFIVLRGFTASCSSPNCAGAFRTRREWAGMLKKLKFGEFAKK